MENPGKQSEEAAGAVEDPPPPTTSIQEISTSESSTQLQQERRPPPPLSPLTGSYLLIVVGEPHSERHKEIILQKIAKAFLSWDVSKCHVGLEKELQVITGQSPEGEEARYGERLIQYATENLVTEILIHPQLNTLHQCLKNLLSSFTKHRHIIHAGYTFAGNGSWILQDGTLSISDLIEALHEPDVLRVLKAYENSVSIDVHCASEGDWTNERFQKEPVSKLCNIRINPGDVMTAGNPAISAFIDYLSPFLEPANIQQLLQPTDVVGNIRFTHPTLYVFPGGQGDAALFGINGFNMLIDGGFARKACFWDFARHLDRLDAVLLTRLNNSTVNGISAVLQRKKMNHVYPQIGHFFCNLQDRKIALSPDGDKDKDSLIVNLAEEGQEIVANLRHLALKPHPCYRDGNQVDPVNLYHKVGHGKLDMYVISPARDSQAVKEFLAKWSSNDSHLFSNTGKKYPGKSFEFPLQNLVSICALLVWQPANPNDTITRILFPGSTPQHKIFEGLEKLRHLEFLKHPVCSAKSISPSVSATTVTRSLSKTRQPKPADNKQKETKIISKPQVKPVKPKTEKTPPKELKSKLDNKLADIKNESENVEEPLKKLDNRILSKDEQIENIKKEIQKIEQAENEEQKKKIVHKSKYDMRNVKSKVDSRAPSKSIDRKKVPEKKPEGEISPPGTPKKAAANGTTTKTEKAKVGTKLTKAASPTSTPAKSAKEANNRKVVEGRVTTRASAPSKSVPKKKEETPPPPSIVAKTERKPISRRPKTPHSPVKTSTGKPKTEPEPIPKKVGKKPEVDTALIKTASQIISKELVKGAETEKTEIEEGKIEIKKLEKETTENKETDSKAVKNEVESAQVKSEPDEEEEEEEEEYLIITKEEYGDESAKEEESGKENEEEVQTKDETEGEGEMKKLLREEEESEKKRENVYLKEEEEQTEETGNKKVDEEKRRTEGNSGEKTPEGRESELQRLIEVDEGIDLKEPVSKEHKEGESLPEEKMSNTLETSATTAPTLPEDERIEEPAEEERDHPEDVREVIEEKYIQEETKEEKKEEVIPEFEQSQIPTTIDVAGSPVPLQSTQRKHPRDIVKTPDEVAELPMHEEVDPRMYSTVDFAKEQQKKPEDEKIYFKDIVKGEANILDEENGSESEGSKKAQKLESEKYKNQGEESAVTKYLNIIEKLEKSATESKKEFIEEKNNEQIKSTPMGEIIKAEYEKTDDVRRPSLQEEESGLGKSTPKEVEKATLEETTLKQSSGKSTPQELEKKMPRISTPVEFIRDNSGKSTPKELAAENTHQEVIEKTSTIFTPVDSVKFGSERSTSKEMLLEASDQDLEKEPSRTSTPVDGKKHSSGISTPQDSAKVTSGKSTPLDLEKEPSRTSTPVDFNKDNSGKSTPKELAVEDTHQEVVEKTSTIFTPVDSVKFGSERSTSKEMLLEASDQDLEKEPSRTSTPVDGKKHSSGISTPPDFAKVTSGKSTPQLEKEQSRVPTPENLIKSTSGKTTPRDLFTETSGKSTPQDLEKEHCTIPSPVDLERQKVSSGKSTPLDVQKNISGTSSPIEREVATSGRSTPIDFKKEPSEQKPELGKSTPDSKLSETEFSKDFLGESTPKGKLTPTKDLSELDTYEGSASREVISGKSTPLELDKNIFEKTEHEKDISGKTTPQDIDKKVLTEPTPSDLEKEIAQDIIESEKDGFGKSTLVTKDILDLTKEELEKSTPQDSIVETTRISTTPDEKDISRKSTPEHLEMKLSGKSTPQDLDLETSRISTPNEVIREGSEKFIPEYTKIEISTPNEGKDIFGKSTPQDIESSKISMPNKIKKEVSGKSTPEDINMETFKTTTSNEGKEASGKSTPQDLAKDESEKPAAEAKNVSDGLQDISNQKSRKSTPHDLNTETSRISTPIDAEKETSRKSTPHDLNTETSRISTPIDAEKETSRKSTPHDLNTETSRISTPIDAEKETSRKSTPHDLNTESSRISTPIDAEKETSGKSTPQNLNIETIRSDKISGPADVKETSGKSTPHDLDLETSRTSTTNEIEKQISGKSTPQDLTKQKIEKTIPRDPQLETSRISTPEDISEKMTSGDLENLTGKTTPTENLSGKITPQGTYEPDAPLSGKATPTDVDKIISEKTTPINYSRKTSVAGDDDKFPSRKSSIGQASIMGSPKVSPRTSQDLSETPIPAKEKEKDKEVTIPSSGKATPTEDFKEKPQMEKVTSVSDSVSSGPGEKDVSGKSTPFSTDKETSGKISPPVGKATSDSLSLALAEKGTSGTYSLEKETSEKVSSPSPVDISPLSLDEVKDDAKERGDKNCTVQKSTIIGKTQLERVKHEEGGSSGTSTPDRSHYERSESSLPNGVESEDEPEKGILESERQEKESQILDISSGEEEELKALDDDEDSEPEIRKDELEGGIILGKEIAKEEKEDINKLVKTGGLETEEELDSDHKAGVKRMLVTASSEDGGTETEICIKSGEKEGKPESEDVEKDEPVEGEFSNLILQAREEYNAQRSRKTSYNSSEETEELDKTKREVAEDNEENEEEDGAEEEEELGALIKQARKELAFVQSKSRGTFGSEYKTTTKSEVTRMDDDDIITITTILTEEREEQEDGRVMVKTTTETTTKGGKNEGTVVTVNSNFEKKEEDMSSSAEKHTCAKDSSGKTSQEEVTETSRRTSASSIISQEDLVSRKDSVKIEDFRQSSSEMSPLKTTYITSHGDSESLMTSSFYGNLPTEDEMIGRAEHLTEFRKGRGYESFTEVGPNGERTERTYFYGSDDDPRTGRRFVKAYYTEDGEPKGSPEQSRFVHRYFASDIPEEKAVERTQFVQRFYTEETPYSETEGKYKFVGIVSEESGEHTDFGKAIDEHVAARGEYLGKEFQEGLAKCANGKSKTESEEEASSSSSKDKGKEKDVIEGWGKPLGLPLPPKNMNKPYGFPGQNISTTSTLSTPTDNSDSVSNWGHPMNLPSPAPPSAVNGTIEATASGKGTPKKEKKVQPKKNGLGDNKSSGTNTPNRRSESPVKQVEKRTPSTGRNNKPSNSHFVYMDLTYVPHHGNSYYSNVEFFKKVRARYYVFSGTEPSKEVYNALLEAKQTWEDKKLEVTIIPTYDTDVLGYWVAENEEILAKHKIDLSPSASRCTINLQDHETSCSAYRLEF